MINTYTPDEFQDVEMVPGERYRIVFTVPANLSQESRTQSASRVELAIINSKQFRHIRSGFMQNNQEYFEEVEVRAPAADGLGVAPAVVVIAGVALISIVWGLVIAFSPKTIERIASSATTAMFPLAIIALVVAALFFGPEIKTMIRERH